MSLIDKALAESEPKSTVVTTDEVSEIYATVSEILNQMAILQERLAAAEATITGCANLLHIVGSECSQQYKTFIKDVEEQVFTAQNDNV